MFSALIDRCLLGPGCTHGVRLQHYKFNNNPILETADWGAPPLLANMATTSGFGKLLVVLCAYLARACVSLVLSSVSFV